MTKSLEGLDWRIILAGLIGTLVAILMSYGCILNPGAQVREALSQTKTYEWTESGTIRVHGIGPQEEAFLMMEGSIVMGDDGEIDWAASKITHYLKSEPSADEAMATMAAILISNQKITEATYKSINDTLNTIAGVLGDVLPYLKPPAPPAGEGDGDGG